GILIHPPLYDASTGIASIDGPFSQISYGVDATLAAFALLPSVTGQSFGSNGPLWSICNECFYYLIYPAWLSLRAKSRWLSFAAVPVVCFGLASVIPLSGAASIVRYYPVWIAGALLAELHCSGAIKREQAGLLVAVGIASFIAYQAIENIVWRVCFACVFGATTVALFVIHRHPRLPAVVERTIHFVGFRSYSIYIFHFPILVLFAAVTLSYDGRRPDHPILLFVSAITSVGFGVVMFFLVERRFVRRPIGFKP
ncbi:MAG: acyltransferase family protein, partial [Planctomycetota bacterium]